MKLRFLGRSAAHAETVDAWWRKYRPSAPDLFARELTEALRLLAKAPEMGVPYEPKAGLGVRRLLLQRTKYHLYYAHDRGHDILGVLAIWSSRRGRAPSLRFFKGLRERQG